MRLRQHRVFGQPLLLGDAKRSSTATSVPRTLATTSPITFTLATSATAFAAAFALALADATSSQSSERGRRLLDGLRFHARRLLFGVVWHRWRVLPQGLRL